MFASLPTPGNMRMKSYKPLNLAWMLVLGSALLLHAAPIPTAPIYTKQRSFRIPFHFNSDELSRLGAREIRLYVSRDRGRTWQLDQTVFSDHGRFSAETNKFKFQAATDGEYWFLVRTLDSRNHLYPDMNTTDPGLQVVVDSKPPRLELELRQPTAGSVQLLWNASDDHLDTTELRLEYLQPGAADWQSVSVIPKASGQTSWEGKQGGVVAVRGSIADIAGNSTREEVELRILPASQVVPRPRGAETRQPVAGPAANPGSGQGSEPREKMALNMPDRFPSSSSLQRENVADEAAAAVKDPPPKETPQIVRWPSTDMTSSGGSPKSSFISHKPDNHLGVAAEPPATSAASERTVSERPVPEHLRRTSTAGRKRVVDSKRFQIGYNLEGV